MGGNRSRRADGGKARAEELHRLAAACRAFARDFERARADVSSGDLGRVLVRGIDIARDFRRAGLDCDLDLGPELTRELESGHVPTTDALAENLARRLDKASVDLLGRGHAAEARILARLAGWLLPPGERWRFVAEQLGNLGACEHWWQRVAHLRGVAIGTPRLAWMMRREGRRRGA